MKKFLFTLAALLVAGTAFADSYLYVAKTDYANATPGDLVIPVRAHYEELVSAWQADFTFPEGMTFIGAEQGADMNLEYMNRMGRTTSLKAPLYGSEENPTRFITAVADAGYWNNPETGAIESYGSVKWAVGDYEEMLLLYVTVTNEYQGGDISIHFAPACGEEKRPANMVGIRSDAKVIDMPAVDNLLTGKVVIGDVEAETGLVPVSYDAQDGNIRVARINGAEVALNQGKIQLTEEGTYFISACATANGYNEIIGTKIVTWTKPVTVEKPTITFAGEETTTMTVTVECEDTEATLIVNGEEIESNVYTYTVERADLYTAGTVEVTAQAKKGDVLSEEVKESKDWVVKEKPQFEASVKVNHTGDENNFYLLYRTEGNDPDQNPEVTVTVTVDGTPLTNVEFLQNWTLVQDDTDPDNGYMKAIYNHVKLTEPGEHIVKVELTVAPGPGYVGEPKTASAEWKYTINNKFQGEIVFGDVDPTTGKMSVTYNGPETGYTMSISLNGQDAVVGEDGMIQLQEGENKIIVTLTKAGYDMKTAEATPTWTKPAPKDLQGEIVFGDVDEETGLMPVSYNGNENVTLTVTINGEQVEVVDGKVQLVDGNNAVVVTATAAGYNDLTETKEIEWTKPVVPVEDKIYVKFTGTELPVGKKIIFVYENGENSFAMGTVDTKGAPVAVVVANGEVNIANTEVVEFTVGGGEVAFGTDIKQYTLEYSAGFLAYNSSTNFKTLTSIGTYDNDAYWRLQTGDNGYVLNNAATASRYIRKHATSNKFGPYAKNNDSEEVVIYVEKTDEPVLEDLTGEITIGDPDDNGGVAVAYTGDENVTLTVTVKDAQDNVVPATFENGVVTLPDYGTYTVEVVASADGYNDKEAEKEVTWTKPTPKELTGEITIGDPDDNGGVAVAYTGDENVTLTVTVKDAQDNVVPATFENGVVTLPDYGTYTVEVVASADGYNDKEANKEVTWTKPTPKELTGEITFSVTQGNKNNEAAGIVTATYNGPETGVTVKIVGDPTKVAAATSEGVRLPDYGTYQVKAIATAEGYADLNGEGQVTWEEPQTAAPEITVTEDGLTVEATGAEGTVTLYVVNADGSETAIDNPTTFDQKDESYTVNLKAVAHVDGAKDGVATKSIIIPAKSTEPGTGVNELVDGKAVKSVRYFNMAGQEMQEVNGVTIVVTTYTDGTTSAVKVMK